MKASFFALTVLFGATSVSALDPVMKDLCEQTVKNYAHFSDAGQREKFSALFTHDGVLVTSVGVCHDTFVIENGVCKFKERIAKASFSGRG